jgi:hypothetical protein
MSGSKRALSRLSRTNVDAIVEARLQCHPSNTSRTIRELIPAAYLPGGNVITVHVSWPGTELTLTDHLPCGIVIPDEVFAR